MSFDNFIRQCSEFYSFACHWNYLNAFIRISRYRVIGFQAEWTHINGIWIDNTNSTKQRQQLLDWGNQERKWEDRLQQSRQQGRLHKLQSKIVALSGLILTCWLRIHQTVCTCGCWAGSWVTMGKSVNRMWGVLKTTDKEGSRFHGYQMIWQ